MDGNKTLKNTEKTTPQKGNLLSYLLCQAPWQEGCALEAVRAQLASFKAGIMRRKWKY